MGATTGIMALFNYTSLTTNGNRARALLNLLPNPDVPGGYPENGGGGFLDQLTPPASAQLRVELTAMIAAMTGGSGTPGPSPSPTPTVTPVGAYSPPASSTFPFATHPVSITKNANGSFSTTLDPKSKVAAAIFSGPQYWVDPANGSDANAGTTQATAFANPAKALDTLNKNASATGGRIMLVGDGNIYDLSKGLMDSGNAIGLSGIRPQKHVAWIGFGATMPIIGTFRLGLAYVAGTNGSWTVTRSNVLRVTDRLNLDANGDETDLVMRDNDASVDASNGWFLYPASDATNPSRLKIKRPDGAQPTDANTRVYLNADNLHLGAGNFDAYVEKLDLRGGLHSLNGGSGGTRNVIVVDVETRYSGGTPAIGSGMRFAGFPSTSFVGVFRGMAAKAAQDAISFTGDFAWLTVDCIGRDCGMQGSTSNNGLTQHQNNKGIDLNGQYYRNAGGNVRMIDQTDFLGLNTRASNDRGDVIFGGNLPPCDFNFGGTATANLDGCIAAGSQISIALDASTVVNQRQCTFPNQKITNGQLNTY